ncbi:MAG: hypothetical protein KTR31_28315 [Myxococcales bacterium]|nr:hypothetical protein [Myxococcales bacterium]
MVLWSSTLLSWAAAAETAPCDSSVAGRAVERWIRQGETTYGALDVKGFFEAIERIEQRLRCVDARLSGNVVARLHRLAGLAAWTRSDESETTSSFVAARVADPALTLPEALAPEGHPLHELFRRAVPPPERSMRPVTLPEGVAMFVDGYRGTQLPTGRSCVVQIVDRTGTLVSTEVVGPEDLPFVQVPDVRRRADLALSLQQGWWRRWAGFSSGWSEVRWTVGDEEEADQRQIRVLFGMVGGAPWTPLRPDPNLALGVDLSVEAAFALPPGDGTLVFGTVSTLGTVQLGASAGPDASWRVGLALLAGPQTGAVLLHEAYVNPEDGALVNVRERGEPFETGFVRLVTGAELRGEVDGVITRLRFLWALPVRRNRGSVAFRWGHLGVQFGIGG